MEARFHGKARSFHGPNLPDQKSGGKKSVEWDPNDWKWDGDLLTATPLNAVASDCRSRQLFPLGPENGNRLNSSSSCSVEYNVDNDTKGKKELEKRRRTVVDCCTESCEGAESLDLKLGAQVQENLKSGKKTKVAGSAFSRAVCQVEGCDADLSNARDYYRRHKVCEMHSKVSKAVVGNAVQRFCQQCSRFHLLQEFDEGKRSCRRRLAGHNKRRRKTNPQNVVSGVSLPDGWSSSYLLVSLLRLLSNMHSNNADPSKNQDLLSCLLRSLSNHAGSSGEKNTPSVLQGSLSAGICTEKHGKNNGDAPSGPQVTISGSTHLECLPVAEAAAGKIKINNIDSNCVYNDPQEHKNNMEKPCGAHHSTDRVEVDYLKSSPPQVSGNSDSTPSQTPSSSCGEAQSRTDRIVFKLFGKDPSEIPAVLRGQILDWLSSSPSEIEGYIRPGCIVLTVYLRLWQSTWDGLCSDLGSWLRMLLDATDEPFWRSGWVYARVLNRVAFIHNGQVLLDMPLPLKGPQDCEIISVTPVAVTASERAKFIIKGFNFSRPSTRLQCALEGKYLAQENPFESLTPTQPLSVQDDFQRLSFSCTIPNTLGRGFIEVDDICLSSSSFPFIVAEEEVCSEICALEDAFEAAEETKGKNLKVRNEALNFIHEIGWLLHRHQKKSWQSHSRQKPDLFPLIRFKWLLEFSMDHDWCAVVKKLLDMFFNETVDSGEHSSIKSALMSMGVLHRAVRRKNGPMVELLLRYLPGSERNHHVSGVSTGFIFKPDSVGPAGLTPLHVAASTSASEDVLDTLTNDPEMVGVQAWSTARDKWV